MLRQEYKKQEHKKFISLLFVIFLLFALPSVAYSASINSVNMTKSSVPVYEKQEITFQIVTNSKYPFFEYSTNPPPGIAPGIGITVEGEFRNTTTGKTSKHPAFYMTKVIRSGTGDNTTYTETNDKYWVLRFSPQEVGQYEVLIRAIDSSGTSTAQAGLFAATSPTKKGFIRVSPNDSRYFEFSNGEIYWPIGPAWYERDNWDYSQYKDTGTNLERPWMGGRGMYTSNFARWWSSAEEHGNEGTQTHLSFTEKAPGSDLSYELFYPNGFRYWLSEYHDNFFYTKVIPNTKYKVLLRYKTVGITGPRQTGDHGLTVKIHKTYYSSGNEPPFENKPPSMIEPLLANAPKLFPHINQNRDWTTLETTFTTPSSLEGTDLSIMLDNVTGGKAYIDEFSLRQCLDASCGSLGGEIIRNSRPDIHTYVEQRPAAFYDYQVEQAERNGVFLKYVVHDKNDWIQNHLLTNGQWANEGDGYYQPENTKARWLLRQYYRYLVGRWGYSTAVFGWELNNEGPPNDDPAGTKNSPHWETTEAFARYIKSVDSHPHTASTSFWCCWRPDFWGNNTKFGGPDYADIHDYINNSALAEYTGTIPNPYDIADWRYKTALMVKSANIGKPTLIGETGLFYNDPKYPELEKTNSGLWYHDMLWVELADAVIYDFNYWYPEHIERFNRISITKPFWDFVKNTDIHKGGYVQAQATSTDANTKVYGQKNLSKNKALLWIKNKNHTWQADISNPNGNFALTGTVTFRMNANTSYPVIWYNTFSGSTISSDNIHSNSSGDITLALSGLSKDVAAKIGDFGTIVPTNTPGAPIATATTVQATSTNSPVATATPAINIGNGDVNGDGQVNGTDARMIFANFFRNITNTIDQYADGVINSFDFAVSAFRIRNNPTVTAAQSPSATATRVPATSTPQPSNTPPVATVTNSPVATPTPEVTLPPSTPGAEWTQHGQNAQRTSYSAQAVPTPWKWKWTWNGPDNPNANPGSGTQSISNKIRIPKNVQPVAGEGRVYTSAGSNGIYAVDIINGNQVWNSRPGGNINSSAAYDADTQSVFVVSTNGNLYKLNATSGATSGSFASGSTSTLPLPPAINGNSVYFSMGNSVYAVNKNTMARVWAYSAGSTLHTPPSYSATRDIVIAVSQDLYVHAIKNSDGSRAWRVKPTILVPGDPESSPSNDYAIASYGWPVVADRSGIVFIKYQLDWNTMWSYGSNGAWPTTNEAMRSFLLANPDEQPLFALNLTDGTSAFVPNVGHGGFGDGDVMPIGPMPAVKTLSDNKEVAYMMIRGELASVTDGRGDSKFGELVIDPSTANGYQAGYVRFIEYNKYGNWERYHKEWGENTSDMPTDEEPQMTVAGDQILGGHWMAAKNLAIVDRGSLYGTFTNPILSMPLPHVVTSTSSSATDGCTFSTSHYCTGTIITQEGDTRLFAGPGFYIYYGNYGYSGNNSGSAIYDRFWSEYATWIVSNGTAIFRSTDGALMAFGNGNPTSQNIKNVNQNVAGISTNKVSDAKSETIYKITADVAQNYIDKNVIMSGTISQTFDNGKAFYIALGTRSQNGFVIRIMKEDKANFEYNLKEKFAVGSKITITGKMGSYQGDPVMYIDDPAEIIIVR